MTEPSKVVPDEVFRRAWAHVEDAIDGIDNVEHRELLRAAMRVTHFATFVVEVNLDDTVDFVVYVSHDAFGDQPRELVRIFGESIGLVRNAAGELVDLFEDAP